ncbi:bifunctional PBS lyase HEAT-like repeat/Armadillo-like helical/Armadillo-type fold [Babesia duncani]|uniref:Bifunctional PBS lyase HEAT-like repeat/Armadillo-like helical/Armadillo-type fold n=1 Tax=Babesia duncani TaxID=323732 RepID=A0AAD9UNE1_9APIC|nr:bifunctional PBS lyase HEAT-like repeat/Armadillo-like helical/Armadillo-type fold [Babesia duncani]
MDSIEKLVEGFDKLDGFSKPSADILEGILLRNDVKLSTQLRALYYCRDLDIGDCTRILKAALNIHFDTFLRHEIAYVLGQAGCVDAGDVLANLLFDINEDPMVRHEAAEALAALGDTKYIELVKLLSVNVMV